MQIDLGTARYAGFWARLLAMVLDTIVQALLLAPVFFWVYGPAFLSDPTLLETPLGYFLNYGLPLLYVVLFWKFKSATPGKIMMDMSVVDEKTGGQPPTGMLVLRYLGYYLCIFTLFLGFIWIAFDKRKQGLHDKIAGTVVVMNPPKEPVP